MQTNAITDYWQTLENELYAISEQIEIEASTQLEQADHLYYVANQLHALNATGETDEMTERQKRAFLSSVRDELALFKQFNQMRKCIEHNQEKEV